MSYCKPDNIVIPIVGPQGPAGYTGPTGQRGNSFTGLMGPVGIAGLEGPEGPFGTIGPNGPAGIVGFVGPTGQASPGPTGGVGLVGPLGPAGANGAGGGTEPVVPYAYLDLTVQANGPTIDVLANSPVIFTNSVTSADFTYAAGILTVLSTGFYQINFGFNATAVQGIRPALFALVRNGLYLGEEYAVQSRYEQMVAPIELTTSGVSASVVAYLNATGTLELRNGFNNGQPVTFQNTVNDITNSFADGAICAYMNVVRLNNL